MCRAYGYMPVQIMIVGANHNSPEKTYKIGEYNERKRDEGFTGRAGAV
jgi:hypothetical protein